jgi:hypothetical protein
MLATTTESPATVSAAVTAKTSSRRSGSFGLPNTQHNAHTAQTPNITRATFHTMGSMLSMGYRAT